MPQAARALHTLAVEYVEAGELRLDSAKKLTSYYVSSVLSHHKLYQFVFKQERQDNTSTINLTVEIPVNYMALKDAQPLSHWKYQQRLDSVEQEENNQHDDISNKEKILNEEEMASEMSIDRKLQDKEYDNIDLELLAAQDFISSLTAEKIGMVQKSIEIEVQKVRNKAQNAMNTKAIPVPKDIANAQAKVEKEAHPKSPKSTKSRSRPTSSAAKNKRA